MPNKEINKITVERIRILFQQAEEIHNHNPKLAQRYADLARKIAMRNRIHLPQDLRRRICPQCKTYIVPGANSRTRIRQRREPHVVTTCLKCGYIYRMPFKEKKP